MPGEPVDIALIRATQAIEQAGMCDPRSHARRHWTMLGDNPWSDAMGDPYMAAFEEAHSAGAALTARGAEPSEYMRLVHELDPAYGIYPHALVAGLVCGMGQSPDALVAFRNVYDDFASTPPFPPALRDLTWRVAAQHPTSEPRMPYVEGGPGLQAMNCDRSVTMLHGLDPLARRAPRHTVRLLVPYDDRVGNPWENEAVRGFLPADESPDADVLRVVTLLPRGASVEELARAVAEESAALALYARNESPQEDEEQDARPRVNTVAFLDPGPQGERMADSVGIPLSEWIPTLVAMRALPVDALAVCGSGDGPPPSRWRLPPRLPLLDLRGLSAASLPLSDMESAGRAGPNRLPTRVRRAAARGVAWRPTRLLRGRGPRSG